MDPTLESLRGAPEFQAVVAEVKADIGTQLSRVRQLEARGQIQLFREVVND